MKRKIIDTKHLNVDITAKIVEDTASGWMNLIQFQEYITKHIRFESNGTVFYKHTKGCEKGYRDSLVSVYYDSVFYKHLITNLDTLDTFTIDNYFPSDPGEYTFKLVPKGTKFSIHYKVINNPE